MNRPLNIGSTTFQVIGKYHDITLRFYSNGIKSSFNPIFILPSIINRSYILDLVPGRSLIEYFVQSGLEVYMVDWGVTVEQNPHLTLQQLVEVYIDDFASLAQEYSGGKKLQIFGHCLGGTLGLLYSSFQPASVRNLHLLTSPIDFRESGVLGKWASETPFDLELFTNAYEKAPAWLLQTVFQLAKPASWPFKISKLINRFQDPEFVNFFLALEYWSWDSGSLSGPLYQDLIQNFYRDNALVSNKLKVGDGVCDLSKVTCQIYNISVSDDHIVPLSSTLQPHMVPNAKVYHQVLKGGHIGGTLGSYAQKNQWPEWMNQLKQKDAPICQNFI